MVYTRTSEDPILSIPEGSAGHGRGQVQHGNAPPPPPRLSICLEQLLATQNDLMRSWLRTMSVAGLNASNLNTKTGILRTQTFWQLTHQSLLMRLAPWRRTTGSAPQSPSSDNFTVQSTRRLYAAQQLRGSARAWWVTYTATLPADHQVPWG
jgi:hypothetical protein